MCNNEKEKKTLFALGLLKACIFYGGLVVGVARGLCRSELNRKEKYLGLFIPLDH